MKLPKRDQRPSLLFSRGYMKELIKAIKIYSKSQLVELNRPTHHFRDRYSHTLRVLEWAKKIHKAEGGDMDVITCAVYLHDIGWEEGRNHADVSYEKARDFLKAYDIKSRDKEKILEAIKYHNRRDDFKKVSKETQIVMDADLLDEVGALSILWDAMAEGDEDEASYESAIERIKKYSNKLENELDLVVTKAGKEIYKERLKVRERFIEELEFELKP